MNDKEIKELAIELQESYEEKLAYTSKLDRQWLEDDFGEEYFLDKMHNLDDEIVQKVMKELGF